MTKYEFALILKGQFELTEEIADELFEAGCDDGTPGICNGVFSIDFHREGDFPGSCYLFSHSECKIGRLRGSARGN